MNKTINFWIFGISIFLLGISIFLNISHSVISNESIVLTFIGILATFIVVGNFAQVSEIRNNFDKQVHELEFKMQNKIDQLKSLFDEVNETKTKLTEIQNDTYYATAEAYRLYGIYNSDQNKLKNSTTHFISAIEFYNKTGIEYKLNKFILNLIIRNLKSDSWNQKEPLQFFNYSNCIKIIEGLPDKYEQKIEILRLLKERELETNK